MEMVLRIVLILVAICSCMFAVRKIRKAQMRIEDTLFWVVMSVIILMLGVFPQIAYKFAYWLHIQSPVNFVYLAFIFLLLFKTFILSVQVSQLQEKIKNLTQNIAVRECVEKEQNKKKEL